MVGSNHVLFVIQRPRKLYYSTKVTAIIYIFNVWSMSVLNANVLFERMMNSAIYMNVQSLINTAATTDLSSQVHLRPYLSP